MRETVKQLDRFYKTKCGLAARIMVMRRLQTLWPDLSGRDVLGYGYAPPYLAGHAKMAHRLIYAMPNGQGARPMTGRRGNMAARTLEHQLPFQPGIFDRVLVVHGLEETPNIGAVLTELWRVMQPEGRIVVVCASRTGLWAKFDSTPFGAGRPFSRRQLSGALRAANFEPIVRSGALYVPPHNRLAGRRTAMAFERFGETVWPGFSGLVLVEAVKRLYGGLETPSKSRAMRPAFIKGGALGAADGRAKQAENRQMQDKKAAAQRKG